MKHFRTQSLVLWVTARGSCRNHCICQIDIARQNTSFVSVVCHKAWTKEGKLTWYQGGTLLSFASPRSHPSHLVDATKYLPTLPNGIIAPFQQRALIPQWQCVAGNYPQWNISQTVRFSSWFCSNNSFYSRNHQGKKCYVSFLDFKGVAI